MPPYPPELKAEARRLRTEEGLGYKTIAQKVGVSDHTVRRWIDEDFRLRTNVKNAIRKSRYRGICVDCGGSTAHRGGKDGPKTAIRCLDCHQLHLIANHLWTRENVVAAIQRWAKEHGGRPPAATQWIKRGEYWPTLTSVYGCGRASPFTSWNEAIEAAGFTPRPTSPGPGNITWSREEGARLRAKGVPDKEIAERFGVTPSAIGQSLGPRPKPKPVRPKRRREERIADLQKALEKENL